MSDPLQELQNIMDNFVYNNSEDVGIQRYLNIDSITQWSMLDMDNMKSENNRLATLMNWPHKQLLPDILAYFGFYSNGKGDYVFCGFCHIKLRNWTSIINLLDDHEQIDASCRAAIDNSENQPLYVLANPGCGLSAGIFPMDNITKFQAKPRCYRSEQNRLNTFITYQWNRLIPSADTLARKGFVMLEDGRTRCVYCTHTIDQWKTEDNPHIRHSKENADCPFVIASLATDNEPISPFTAEEVTIESRPNNVPAFTLEHGSAILSRPSQAHQMYMRNQIIMGDTNNHGQFTHLPQTIISRATHAHMTSMAARRRSFNSCQVPPPISINRCVAAGFFSHGIGDLLICFHCNGGLENWNVNHQPWVRHAQYYPNCGFLISQKGQNFVRAVTTQFQRELANQDDVNRIAPRKIMGPGLCLGCGNEAEYAFQSCGHICVCGKCLSEVTMCPRCHTKVHSPFRAYI
jgi:hypothetical protein